MKRKPDPPPSDTSWTFICPTCHKLTDSSEHPAGLVYLCDACDCLVAIARDGRTEVLILFE